jgi:hypothetical protein
MFVAVVAVLSGSPAPASADAPGPTDYQTSVKSIEPTTDRFEIEIIGGDSFVLLRQLRPSTIEIVGYNGEPYLRFLEDGTVEQNRRSPAVYLNEERYGDDPDGLPAVADASADPEWEVVADDGTYAWHDHRAHWMLRSRPFGAEPGDQILEGVIPVRVDGVEVDVLVASFWVSPPSKLPLLGGALIGILGAVVAYRQRSGVGVLLTIATLGALVVGVAQYQSVPSETGPSISLIFLPGLALLAVIGALVVRSRPASALPLLIGSAVALITFASLRMPGITRSILPTDLAFPIDRAISTGVLVVAVACLVATSWELSRLLQGPPTGGPRTG